MRNFPLSACISVTALAGALAAIPAAAQSTDSSGTAAGVQLDEIIVTAQRRDENLQRVPITVSAVSGEMAEARGIRETADLNIVAPGLNVSRDTGTPQIYLRGVGSNNATAGQEQAVAVYVDGVYSPSLAAELGSFADVERIEVLKGPQGTLFGRNATGGLIQIITKEPGDELSGRLSATYANYETVTLNGYIGGPLSENVGASIAANYQNQGKGWGRSTAGFEVQKGEVLNLRGKLVARLGETTKITLTGALNTNDNDFGDAVQVLTTTLYPALGGSVYTGDVNNSTVNEDVGTTINQKSASLKIEQELSFATLTSTTAFDHTKRATFLDNDRTIVLARSAYFPDDTKSASQEFQLASLPGSNIKWILGGLYFYSKAIESPLITYAGGAARVPVAVFDTGQITNSYSAYGQATIPLGERTNLTLGGRYTSDRRVLFGTFTAGGVTITPSDATRKKTFGRFTYKVALDHRVTDDVLVYASLSTGFRSGVYNISFSTPTDAPVEPETLTAYEVGIKSELFDRRVRFNLSGFYYDYKDLQLQTFVTPRILLINAASTKIYGAEAEFEAQLAPGLRFMSSGSVIRSEYKDFPNAPTYNTIPTGVGVLVPGYNAAGNDVARTPRFTFNAALDYRTDVSFGEIGGNISYYHNSGFYWEPDNKLRQPAYDLVNAEISWTSSSDMLSARLWAKNLFDKQYFYGQSSGANVPDGGRGAAPRTYGVTLGVKF